MTPRKNSRKVTAAKRRELEVAAAVAREAVLQLHVTRAMKTIDLAGDRVSAHRMLSIYLRLQGLGGAEGAIVANRVLAMLGQRTTKGTAATLFIEGEEEAQVESRSMFRAVRDRLRGRVHHELRHWVELHTGSTQVAILDIHIRHAVKFVKELAETHNIVEAVELYSELTGVASAIEDALYVFVLDRLAADELPRQKGKRTDEVSLFPPPEPIVRSETAPPTRPKKAV
jgi:hypothetical protein